MSIDKNYLLNESKVFCILPWIHLIVSVDGSIRPCCMASHIGTLSKVSDYTSLSDHLNSPNIKNMRHDLLNEAQVEFCTECYKQEQNGNRSFRNNMNVRWEYLIDTVDRTELETGYLSEPKIHYLDYRTSNFCNLKCVMCDHHNSSAWYHDHQILTGERNADYAILSPTNDKNHMIQSIIDEAPSIEELNFAGGEPLIMKEHYQLLSEMISFDHTRLKLAYNTNFTKLQYKGIHIFDLWKKFDELYIAISLDDCGERGEYIRKGLVWSTIENNLRLLNEQEFKSHLIQIHTVVSVLNIWHITEFHKYMVDNKFVNDDRFSFNMLHYPPQLTIQILPKWFKQQCQEKIEKYIKNELDNEYTISIFNSILNYLNAEDLYNETNTTKFLEYIESLDAVRGSDFKEVFPELKEVYDTK